MTSATASAEPKTRTRPIGNLPSPELVICQNRSTARPTWLERFTPAPRDATGRHVAMDAVIMAAGLGTRLRPHTENVPKPLLPVRGRPILDWALGALPPAVDRVIVVVNYLGEQIEAYLGTQTHV